MRALQEIKKFQNTFDLLLPKKRFMKVVREIAQDFKTDLRFQPAAVLALQEAAEAFLVRVFERTQMFAIHAKRITVVPRDMHLMQRCMNDPM